MFYYESVIASSIYIYVYGENRKQLQTSEAFCNEKI